MQGDVDEESGVSILKCKGIKEINQAHEFLSSEGSFTCKSCQACFCKTCGYSPVKDRDEKKENAKKRSLVYYDNMNDNLCVDCYQQHIFLPYSMSIKEAFICTLKRKGKHLARLFLYGKW